MKHERNCQEWHNTISKDKVERIALPNARWRMFELLKTTHVLNTMFILEYNLVDLSFERNLEEQLKNERKPWRTTMLSLHENSGNKRMIKRKRSWEHKVNLCDDLDGASRRDNAENLELQKTKMNKWNQEFWWTSGIRN